MADGTKHQPFNGRTLISDIKLVLTLLRTKRKSVVLAYGFMFAFIVFTVFLAFNPSPNSSSPWFSNKFSGTTIISNTNSSTSTAISSGGFSSIDSYIFPNSSEIVHNSTTFVSLPTNITISQNTVTQALKLNEEPLILKNQSLNKDLQDKIGAFKPNTTTNWAPNSPVEVKNQTQNKYGDSRKLNNTATKAPKSHENLHDKVGAFKQYQTTIDVQKSPAETNQTGDSAPNSSSSLGERHFSGYGDKRTAEKGMVKNLTSSLSNKQTKEPNSDSEKLVESLMNCDLFDGEWVRDDSYPLYEPGSCSVIDQQFNCFRNGRPDKGFQHYKWKPQNCTLPRLNGSHMLELLRGKRLVFVGDSLNRNMWESLVCILRNSLKDQSQACKASGQHHFRSEPSSSYIFKDYNCSVEFFVSPFLVQGAKNGSKKETLRLDKMGTSANKYRSADIIIFNTGHWWTHPKTSAGKDYFQEGTHVYHELNVIEAFRKALTTWARWVEANVNPSRTLVFFRGYSATHFSGGQWNSGGQCDNETEPIKNETYLSRYPSKMRVLEKILRNMKARVSYLNITRLTDYRKDGHPSMFRKQRLSKEERKIFMRSQDCSHWCLPGVPDAWNEILYAQLLVKQHRKKQQHHKTP